MFSLNQRDQITNNLTQKIERNYQDKKYYENVEILDRVGRHYEGMGISNNDYYREEVNLLLELCEEERIKGFEVSDMLDRANSLYENKLAQSIRTSVTSVRLAMENSYYEMSKGNGDSALNSANYAFRRAS